MTYEQPPQHGYGGQSAEPYHPPNKRAVWPYVLTGFAVVVILVGVGTVAYFLGASGSSEENSTAATTSAPTSREYDPTQATAALPEPVAAPDRTVVPLQRHG